MINKFNNKIVLKIAIIVICFFMFINKESSYALSGSGSGTWTGGQYDSYMETTESIAYNRGILVRKLTNVDTGEKITVFCAEHTEDFVVGVTNDGIFYEPTDEKVKNACKIAYFGWYKKYKDYAVDISVEEADKYDMRLDYAFTQQYIWEVLGQSNATFLDSNIQNLYIKFKQEIDKEIEDIEKKPSFCNQTIDIQAGDSKTIKDTNLVLKDFPELDKTLDEVRIIHKKGENELTIQANDNCNPKTINITEDMLTSWGFIKEETDNNHTTIYLEFKRGVQNQLYSMDYNLPITLHLNLNIQSKPTNLQISKTDITDNSKELEGAQLFLIDENNIIIDKWISGKEPHQIEGLIAGKTYTLREKTAPYGYSVSEDIKFTVNDDGKVQKIEMKDAPILTNIVIDKIDSETNENIKNSYFTFGLYEDEECKNIIQKVDSNQENGTAVFKNLRYGKYYIKEINAPVGYEISNKIIKLQINDEGIIVDDNVIKEKNDTYNIKFYNLQMPEIHTGDETINIGKLSVPIFIVSIGIIYISIKRKNKKMFEK